MGTTLILGCQNYKCPMCGSNLDLVSMPIKNNMLELFNCRSCYRSFYSNLKEVPKEQIKLIEDAGYYSFR